MGLGRPEPEGCCLRLPQVGCNPGADCQAGEAPCGAHRQLRRGERAAPDRQARDVLHARLQVLPPPPSTRPAQGQGGDPQDTAPSTLHCTTASRMARAPCAATAALRHRRCAEALSPVGVGGGTCTSSPLRDAAAVPTRVQVQDLSVVLHGNTEATSAELTMCARRTQLGRGQPWRIHPRGPQRAGREVRLLRGPPPLLQPGPLRGHKARCGDHAPLLMRLCAWAGSPAASMRGAVAPHREL